MKIGIPGSGVVRQTLGAKLAVAGQAVDVGTIQAARGTEMMLPLWVRLWGALGRPLVNDHIVR